MKLKAYAIVAANMSIRLALVTAANVTEKSAVKAIVAPNLAEGFSRRYKTRMDVKGNKEESTVLSVFEIKSKVL